MYVSKGGLKLVKVDGKVLGAFPLQRIQQWGISAPGTFKLQVVTGEKVVGLVIHGTTLATNALIEQVGIQNQGQHQRKYSAGQMFKMIE